MASKLPMYNKSILLWNKQSRKSRRIMIVIIAGILFAFLVVALFFSSGAAARYIPGPGTVFQEYEPTVPPPGLTISGTSLTVTAHSRFLRMEYDKVLSINFSTPHLFLGEEEVRPGMEVSASCRIEVTNEKCQTFKTPDGQEYILKTSFVDDKGMPTKDSDQMILFIRGNTYLFINIGRQLTDKYSSEVWNRFIDSLKPVHYTNIHFDVVGPTKV